jgi:hypothetical protein
MSGRWWCSPAQPRRQASSSAKIHLDQQLGVTIHSFAWHKTPFTTAQDLFQREMVVGGTGAASTTDIYPKVLNAVLGTKFKLITGYQGSKETLIAIERGEADGRFNSWDSMKTTSAN